jgi:hypothetical protein
MPPSNAKRQAQKLYGAGQRAMRHGEVLDTVLVPAAELGAGDQTPSRNAAHRGTLRKHAACNLEEICDDAARAENVMARDEYDCNGELVRNILKQRHRNTRAARQSHLHKTPSENGAPGGEFATVGLGFIVPGAAHHRPQRHDRIPGLVAPLRPKEAEKVTRRAGACSCGCEKGGVCTCEGCPGGCGRRDEALEEEAEAIAWRLRRNARRRQ